MPAPKHVKITSFFLRNYSTLKLTYVTEYNCRPHSDTQTEWIEDELTNWNQMQYVEHTTFQNVPDTGQLLYGYGFVISNF